MKLIYTNLVYEPETAEYDAADYPHQFCEEDGSPVVVCSDDKVKDALVEFFKTYEHNVS